MAPSSSFPSDVAVGIVADPGIPARDARAALRDAGLKVPVVEGTYLEFEASGNSDGDLDQAREDLASYGWDRLIYVTDQPLTGTQGPDSFRMRDDGSLAVVTVPALGVLGQRRRLGRVLSELAAPRPAQTSGSAGVMRLYLGLVRANQPGRLLGALGSVFAAVGATGGFGIFYGSIWMLAQAVSLPRLAGISLVAVGVLTVSLVLSNGLWQKPARRSPRWLGRLDNAVTSTTVGLTVLVVFALGIVALTLLAAVIVPPDYLSEQLDGAAVGVGTYVRIGWFSTALGVLAGAIASNFDRSPKIRSSTYNPREVARREVSRAQSTSDED
ncbi:hypothetical protein C3B44_01210 [Corynebacterium yudongzhengii]|uniref:Uncharacterized protein n=1 Tax=Corynebacterium yudongzhengii TaxID=2080740 RepID=A0A2U1T4T7_9CORY|nr:hypothetical protein [Corynebacterium yudongzhengii]AWB81127.1 hypothetical protein C3B44_01210 [Corynebacterium yudongzhengii]PWC00985.1 hypothetical protein DF222_09905 [Corynebacterium yudongzhengii]